MHTIFTLISLLITLMTGGFTSETATDLALDVDSTAATSQAEQESDGGPEADPLG